MIQKWTRSFTTFLLLSFAVSCTEKKEDNNTLLAGLLLFAANQVKVNTATDLVNESADDYNQNNWGLITGSTLNRFVSDWTANKPSHITGNLIILQTDVANRATGDGTGWSPYVKSDASKGVYVYELNDYRTGFRFNQTRDSGLFSNSVAYQANGEFIDDWLNTFGINPTKDLIVFAVGTGNGTTVAAAPAPATAAGGVQDITRGVYWLRYWGVDIKHLAILNGNLRSNFSQTYTAQTSGSKSTLPGKGNFSVKSIRVDNTIITSGLEDIYEIAKNNLEAQIPGLTTKQFLIDARPTPQFARTASGATGAATTFYITSAYNSAGAPVQWGQTGDANTANNGGKAYVPFEGSIKGAVSFPWLALFEGFTDAGTVSTSDADAFAIGYRYKSKAALKAIFTNKGYTSGATVVSQCRTNFEAQVNGFAALNILGYPSTYYDGSLVEWTALTAGHASSALNKVPADFKWRTDLTSVSSNIGYNTQTTENSATTTNPASTPTIRVVSPPVDLLATTTKKFIQEDKAYKY
ncbi:sulfurtransferase [Leptospira congkakensis]|uniref:Sulfurtransferase n=1 Tax=Leptospira congkakensis TaxID=2484932 RepID=A0A4Z1AAH8_9LEPT|nr:sulfurtransferase [Leptospira congkakensis]TGL88591.1 sulfurtransferase [Leptospira congkakensis]TGL89177.1 sulfurtransferase [Leptospira congkakensis]TGL97144.1 sulfurtransferase [Leptospira congkakensis]